MNRTKYNKIRILVIILVIVFVLELLYVGYRFYRSNKSIYFVGINALETNNDNYVTVGSNNDNDKHYEKAAISMYNAKKEKTFEKLYNVGYNSAFFGVLIEEDDLVAVGSYEKTSKEHSQSVRRALIVKYDKDGEIIFEKDFNLLDNSKFTSIIKCGDDYIVTGQSIYRNNEIGESDGGGVIAKYNKDGDLLWYKTYGDSKEAIFNDLLLIDDYLYVVGVDSNHKGIIVKYDLDGNYIDFNDYKTTDTLGFSGIVNIGHNIYVSGALKTKDSDTDAIIVKYDLNCNYIDQAVYTGKGKERFNKMISDENGNIIVIGTMAYSSKNKDDYNYDGIIAKYNSNLKSIDSVTYGDDRDDYFTDIKTVNGDYLVVGYSSYEDGSYMSKFINYSSALKVLGVD